MVNWKQVEQEYSAGKASVKELAKKYGIELLALYKRAVQEEWRVSASEQTTTSTAVSPNACMRSIGGEMERIERILAMGEALMRQLERATAQLDRVAVKQTTRERELRYGDLDAKGKPTREVIRDTETLEVVEAPIDRSGLRQLSAALKDLSVVARIKNGGEEELQGVEQIMQRLDLDSGAYGHSDEASDEEGDD